MGGGRALASGGWQAPEQRATSSSPRINRRSVPCPDCKAEVDEPCTTATGKVLAGSHRARVRMATRKLVRDRLDAQAVELP